MELVIEIEERLGLGIADDIDLDPLAIGENFIARLRGGAKGVGGDPRRGTPAFRCRNLRMCERSCQE